jgi:integrase
MREKLTPAFVRDAKPPENGDRVIYWDTAMPSFGLMVTKNGSRSFVYQYRNVRHESRRKTWAARIDGSNTGLTLAQAHSIAKIWDGKVEQGLDPLEDDRAERRKAQEERRKQEEAATNTVEAIFEEYLVRECGMRRDADGNATFKGGKIRSGSQRLDAFERLVYPRIGDKQIDEVMRSQIVKMLDEIEDKNGPVMADRTLAYVRKAFNWKVARTDNFNSPIVKGMARTKPKEREGKRVLADDEIRDIWTALDSDAEDIPECFARLQRCLFFAAVRRTEAARMSWPEIERVSRDDYKGDVWTAPAARMKGKLDHAVPLTGALLAVIGERPTDAKCRPFVFSTTGGKKPFSNYSKVKRALDREIAKLREREGRKPMAPWTMQRDVRRTARTLLSRAGVPSEHGERVLAHAIPGVEGVYDRYEYIAEKRNALERLAALIDRIVNPPAVNVIPMQDRRVSQVPG